MRRCRVTTRLPRSVALVGLVLAGVALGACSSGAGTPAALPVSTSATAAPIPSTAPPTSVAPSPTRSPVPYTPQGSTLKLGQRAVVAVTVTDRMDVQSTVPIGVTITSITKGSLAALTPLLSLHADDEQSAAYYIDYTFTNVDGGDLTGADLAFVEGLDAHGKPVGDISSGNRIALIGTFPPCQYAAEATSALSVKGATMKVCAVALVPPASPVVAARWFDTPRLPPPGADYDAKPLTWK